MKKIRGGKNIIPSFSSALPSSSPESHPRDGGGGGEAGGCGARGHAGSVHDRVRGDGDARGGGGDGGAPAWCPERCPAWC